MDPSNPKMSGAAEPLDQLIARHIRSNGIDAAVVAWDLVPAWSPSAATCRWEETLDFYRMLAQSADLPSSWSSGPRLGWTISRSAEAGRQGRHAEGRGGRVHGTVHGADVRAPPRRGRASRKARAGSLQSTRRLAGWTTSPNPDKRILAPAIAALPGRSLVRRRIRGDFRTHKTNGASTSFGSCSRMTPRGRRFQSTRWPSAGGDHPVLVAGPARWRGSRRGCSAASVHSDSRSSSMDGGEARMIVKRARATACRSTTRRRRASDGWGRSQQCARRRTPSAPR